MTGRIKSLEEVSKDIAATISSEERGGLYDESVITDEFYKHLFDNAVIHFAHLTRLATERYYEGSGRTLKFGIVNTAKIGGFACVGEEDIDFIGIHFGTISLVSAIFTRMLSNPSILSHVGNASLETNAGYAYFIPALEDLRNFSPCRPACPIRSAFSKHLTLTGLDFIFGHEITHITNGHLGIINKAEHKDLEKRRAKLTPLEKQAIELDADEGATEWTLLFTEFARSSRSQLRVESDDSLGISWREFYATEPRTLGYSFMASYLTLRMTNPEKWRPDIQLKSFQPLPPYRMGSLMQAYASVLMQILELPFEEAQPVIYAWCVGTEQAFADLLAESGKGELQLSVIDSFFNEVGSYNDKVNEAYETLAKELSEYAMVETSKVTHPRPRTCDYVVLKGAQRGVEFIGILEAKLSATNPKELDLQCFVQGRKGIYGLPFPIRFIAEFDGDMIQEALTADGKNHVALIEEITSLETVKLPSILDKTELLRFALQNSECSKLKADVIQLLDA